MENEKVRGGYVILARAILNSIIWGWPPTHLKIWAFLILKANHTSVKQYGTVYNRGELLTNYDELREAASYKKGFCLVKPSKTVISTCIEKLKKEGMITTRKTTVGFFVKITKYAYYQDPSIYEYNHEANRKITRRQQQPSNINKNEEKLKETNNGEKKEYTVILTKKYSNLEDITEKDIDEIAQHYNVPINFVRSKYEDMQLWAGQQPSNSKLKDRNWRLTLMSWTKRDALKIMERSKGDPTKRAIDARDL
jgi:DNA-binding Lrp family transcriptional regulator